MVRLAVERLLEAEERTLHPLSLEAAVSLGNDLKRETNTILENTSNLVSSMSYGSAGGVYLLLHQETRELYVGSSTELSHRLTHHKFSIKTGTHKNTAINSWYLEEVVVVVLESCEAVKNAETKRSLLEREQHFIDVLKASKDWTLLNIADASSNSSSSSGRSERRSQPGIVSSPSKELSKKETLAPPAPPSPSAFETFYSTVIEQALIPILQEQSASRDVVRLYEGCEDEQERRWFLEFLGSYNSSWLVSLAASGKFPWVAKLMKQVDELGKTNL